MRKLNNVKQLGKTYTHRKAMLANLVTSLLEHERIITTKEKAKELKKVSEKIITKAKKNLLIDDQKSNKAVHNKREVMKTVKNRDVVAKLFDDIAVRVKDRNGGYTRILLLDKRAGDAAEKAIIELVDRKADVKASKSNVKADAATSSKESKKDKKEKKVKKEKKETK